MRCNTFNKHFYLRSLLSLRVSTQHKLKKFTGPTSSEFIWHKQLVLSNKSLHIVVSGIKRTKII